MREQTEDEQHVQRQEQRGGGDLEEPVPRGFASRATGRARRGAGRGTNDQAEACDAVQREREMSGAPAPDVEPRRGRQPDAFALDGTLGSACPQDLLHARGSRPRCGVSLTLDPPSASGDRLSLVAPPGAKILSQGHDPLGRPHVGRAGLGAFERGVAAPCGDLLVRPVQDRVAVDGARLLLEQSAGRTRGPRVRRSCRRSRRPGMPTGRARTRCSPRIGRSPRGRRAAAASGSELARRARSRWGSREPRDERRHVDDHIVQHGKVRDGLDGDGRAPHVRERRDARESFASVHPHAAGAARRMEARVPQGQRPVVVELDPPERLEHGGAGTDRNVVLLDMRRRTVPLEPMHPEPTGLGGLGAMAFMPRRPPYGEAGPCRASGRRRRRRACGRPCRRTSPPYPEGSCPCRR